MICQLISKWQYCSSQLVVPLSMFAAFIPPLLVFFLQLCNCWMCQPVSCLPNAYDQTYVPTYPVQRRLVPITNVSF
ncbi:hypothetical protein DFH94DRAFT_747486, partial [Russula ochroleuca]